MACYLAGIRDEKTLQASFMKGRFVETYIANEIRKSYMNNGIDQPIYYYRDNQQKEIDLVIPHNGTLSLIECKSGINYSYNDVTSFEKLNNTSLQRKTDAIICTTGSPYSIKDNVLVLPVSAI